jgi:hypothetical protein
MQEIYSQSNSSNRLSHFEEIRKHLPLWNILGCVSKQVVRISPDNVPIIQPFTDQWYVWTRPRYERTFGSKVSDELTLLLYVSHASVPNAILTEELKRCNTLFTTGSPKNIGQFQLSLWNWATNNTPLDITSFVQLTTFIKTNGQLQITNFI